MIEWSLRDWMRTGKKPEKMTQLYYLAKITRLAMNEFSYEVKDLLNPEVIEKYLWLDGRVAIWKNPVLGWIVTRVSEVGFDINGFANKWKPMYDIPNPSLGNPPVLGLEDDIVVIYDIESRMLTSNICCKWVEEIADINETIKGQVFNQKTPLIAIAKSPKMKSKLRDAITEIANNVRALLLDDDSLTSEIKALSIDAPFNVSDLQALMKSKESEMLEFLGIDSLSGFQKKERLITDEQESNNQTLSYLLLDRYNSRAKGCEKLRKKGLQIEVSITQTFEPNNTDDSKEGEPNGNDETVETS